LKQHPEFKIDQYRAICMPARKKEKAAWEEEIKLILERLTPKIIANIRFQYVKDLQFYLEDNKHEFKWGVSAERLEQIQKYAYNWFDEPLYNDKIRNWVCTVQMPGIRDYSTPVWDGGKFIGAEPIDNPLAPTMASEHLKIKPHIGRSQIDKECNATYDDATRLMDFLDAWVVRQGGMLNLIKNSCKNRPDAMGCIWNTDQLWRPNINVPMLVCHNCGIPNILSHEDCSERDLLESLKPAAETRQWIKKIFNADRLWPDVTNAFVNWDKEVKTEIASEWDECAPEWVCGYCYEDLTIALYESIYKVHIDPYVKPIQIVNIRGNELKELMLCGYTDHYSDNLPPQGQEGVNYDYAIARRAVRDVCRHFITVGCDYEHSTMGSLIMSNNIYAVQSTNQLNSHNAELVFYTATCMNWIENFYSHDAQIHWNGALVHQPFKNNTYSHHWGGLINNYITQSNIDNSKIVCLGVNTDITVEQLIKMVNKSTVIFGYWFDRIQMEKFGIRRVVNDNVVGYCIPGIKEVLHVNLQMDELINHDGFEINDKLYIVSQIKTIGPYKIFDIHPSVGQLTGTLKHNYEPTKFKMVVPNTLADMLRNTIGYEKDEIDLDLSLLNALFVRNISGNVNFNDLRIFAMGLAHKRFTIHDKVITDSHLTQRQTDMHVLIAIIAMKYKKLQLDNQLALFKLLNFRIIKEFSTLLLNLFQELIDTGIEYIKNSSWLKRMINLLQSQPENNWIHGLTTEDIWSKLLSLKNAPTVTQCRILQLNNIITEKSGEFCEHHMHSCIHSVSTTDNNCACCGYEKHYNENFCYCCKPVKPTRTPCSTPFIFTTDEELLAITQKTKQLLKEKPKYKSQDIQKIQHLFNDDGTPKEGTKAQIPTNVIKAYKDSNVATPGVSATYAEIINKEPEFAKLLEKYTKTQDKSLLKMMMNDASLDDMDQSHIQKYVGANFLEELYYPHLAIQRHNETARPGSIILYSYLKGDYHVSWPTFKVEKLENTGNAGANLCALDAINSCLESPISLEEMLLILAEANISRNCWFTESDIQCIMKIKNHNWIMSSEYGHNIYCNNPTNWIYYTITLVTQEDSNHWTVCKLEQTIKLDIYHNSLPIADNNLRIYWWDQIKKFIPSTKSFHEVHLDLDANNNTMVELLLNISQEAAMEKVHSYHEFKVIKSEHGKYIFTNNVNNLMELFLGRVTVNVDDRQAAILANINLHNQDLSQMTPFDLDALIPDDLTEILINQLKSYVFDWNDFMHKTPEQLIIKASEFKITISPYWSMCTSSDLPKEIKTLDVVIIKDSKNLLHKVKVVTNISGNILLNYHAPFTQDVTLYLPTVSTGSIMRSIIANLHSNRDGRKLKKLLHDATLTYGVAGAGKSRLIIDGCSQGDLVTCLTRHALTNLRNKIQKEKKNNVHVVSYERASSYKYKPFKAIWIDEITMLSYLDINCLVGLEIEKLHLFGDKNQIGMLDLSEYRGVRRYVNIDTYVAPSNLRQLFTSYRIGKGMDAVVQQLDKDFIGAIHNTNFQWIQCNYEDGIHKLQELHITTDVVILCFYNKHVQTIKELWPNNVVTTIHKFQGQECETVVILQQPLSPNNWGIVGKKNYLISALTRASKNTILITAGFHKHCNSVTELLEMRGGFQEMMTGFQSQLLNIMTPGLKTDCHCSKIFDKAVQSYIKTDFVKSPTKFTYHQAEFKRFFECLANHNKAIDAEQLVKTLEIYKIKQFKTAYDMMLNIHNGVSGAEESAGTTTITLSDISSKRWSNYFKDDNIQHLNILGHNVEVYKDPTLDKVSKITVRDGTNVIAEIINRGDTCEVRASWIVNQLIKYRSIELPTIDQKPPFEKVRIRIKQSGLTRMRCLSFLLDSVTYSTGNKFYNQFIPFVFNRVKYVMYKGAGCPTCAGFGIMSDKGHAFVNSMYKEPFLRTIQWSNEGPEIDMIRAILGEKRFLDNNTIPRFINDLYITANYNSTLWKDRLKHIPDFILHKFIFGGGEDYNVCQCSSSKSTQSIRVLQKKFNIPQTVGVHSVMCLHKTYLSLGYNDTLIHHNDSDILRTYQLPLNDWDVFDLIDVKLIEITDEVNKNNVRGLEKINALQAMDYPLKYHMDKGTQVAAILNTEFSKIEKFNKTTTRDIIWISNDSIKLRTVARLSMPRLSIEGCPTNTVVPGVIQLVEGISALQNLKIGNNCINAYAGAWPDLIMQQNLYHVNISKVDTSLTQTYYIPSLTLYNSQLKDFRSAIKNEVQGKIGTMQILNGTQTYSNINLGVNFMHITENDLDRLLAQTFIVSGIIPMLDASNESYFNIYKRANRSFICYNGLTTNHEINMSLIRKLMGTELSHKYLITTNGECLEHIFVQIQLRQDSPRWVYVDSKYFNSNLMHCVVPWINLDWVSLLKGESLIQTREFIVHKKLFRSLTFRATVDLVKFEDMLAYARSLAAGIIITNTGQYKRFNTDINTMLDTTTLAFYLTNRGTEKFKNFLKTINWLTQDSWAMQQVLYHLVDLTATVTDKADKISDFVNNCINNNSILNRIKSIDVDRYESMLKRLEIKIDEQPGKVCWLGHQQQKTHEVTTPQEDDSDSDDDKPYFMDSYNISDGETSDDNQPTDMGRNTPDIVIEETKFHKAMGWTPPRYIPRPENTPEKVKEAPVEIESSSKPINKVASLTKRMMAYAKDQQTMQSLDNFNVVTKNAIKTLIPQKKIKDFWYTDSSDDEEVTQQDVVTTKEQPMIGETLEFLDDNCPSRVETSPFSGTVVIHSEVSKDNSIRLEVSESTTPPITREDEYVDTLFDFEDTDQLTLADYTTSQVDLPCTSKCIHKPLSTLPPKFRDSIKNFSDSIKAKLSPISSEKSKLSMSDFKKSWTTNRSLPRDFKRNKITTKDLLETGVIDLSDTSIEINPISKLLALTAFMSNEISEETMSSIQGALLIPGVIDNSKDFEIIQKFAIYESELAIISSNNLRVIVDRAINDYEKGCKRFKLQNHKLAMTKPAVLLIIIAVRVLIACYESQDSTKDLDRTIFLYNVFDFFEEIKCKSTELLTPCEIIGSMAMLRPNVLIPNFVNEDDYDDTMPVYSKPKMIKGNVVDLNFREPTVMLSCFGSYGDIMPIIEYQKALNELNVQAVIMTYENMSHLFINDEPHVLFPGDWEVDMAHFSKNPIDITEEGIDKWSQQSKAISMMLDMMTFNIVAIACPFWDMLGISAATIFDAPWYVLASQFDRPTTYESQELMTGLPSFIVSVANSLKVDFQGWLTQILNITNSNNLPVKQPHSKVFMIDLEIYKKIKIQLNEGDYCIGRSITLLGNSDDQLFLEAVNKANNFGKNTALVTLGSVNNAELLNNLKVIINTFINANIHVIWNVCGLASASLDYLREFLTSNGINLSSWPKPTLGNKRLTITNMINYATCMPKVNYIVHHGGAGTTHDAYRAQVPQVIFTVAGDQFVYGKSVEINGVGYNLIAHTSTAMQCRNVIEKFIKNYSSLIVKARNIKITNSFDLDLISKHLATLDIETVKPDKTLTRLVKYKDFFDGVHADVQECSEKPNWINKNSQYSGPGMYQLIGQKREVYNPSVTGFCVYMCVDYILKDVTNSRDWLQKFFQESMSMQDTVATILGLGMNVTVNIDNEWTWYNINSSLTVHLEIVKSDVGMHCKLIEPEGQLEIYRMSTGWLPDGDHLWHNSVRLTTPKQLDTIQLYFKDIETNKILPKKVMDVININERLKCNQIGRMHLLMSNPFNIGLLQSGKGYCYVHTYTATMINQIVLMPARNGFAVGISYPCKEGAIIRLFKNSLNPVMGLIINTRASGFKIPTEPEKSISFSSDTKIKALNEVTKNYMKSKKFESNALSVIRVASPKDKDSIIYVGYYDNRCHHTKDEKYILKLAAQIIWMGNPITPVLSKQLDDSYNMPYNRLMYQFSSWKWNHEVKNPQLRQLLQCVLKEAKIKYELNSGDIQTLKPVYDKKFLYIANMHKRDNFLGINDVSLYNTEINFLTQKDLISFLEPIGEDELSKLNLMIASFTDLFFKIEPLNYDDCNLLVTRLNLMDNYYFLVIKHKEYIFSVRHVAKISAVQRGGANPTEQSLMVRSDTDMAVISRFDNVRNTHNQSDPFNLMETLMKRNIAHKVDMNTIHNVPTFHFIDVGFYHEIAIDYQVEDVNNDESQYLFTKMEFDQNIPNELTINFNPVSADIQLLWLNTDLTDWVQYYGPLSEAQIRCNEQPNKVIDLEKHTMCPFPNISRPVLHKVVMEETRSTIGRLYSVVNIRKYIPNTKTIVENLISTYFKRDCGFLLNEWNADANRLTFNNGDIANWLSKRPDAAKITTELRKLLEGEFLHTPINDVNVHIKLESLLKANYITNWQEQQARIIVWQRKAITALYSALFMTVKDRLKMIMLNKFIYTDGFTPYELAAIIRNNNTCTHFFENDLTKQDRQTDEHIIMVELQLYRLLGVCDNVLQSWSYMHDQWRWKSKHNKGMQKSMRLTGQATTALGNVITNLQVHCEFTRKNIEKIEIMLFLGDDMLCCLNSEPDLKGIRRNIEEHFNMQSKPYVFNKHGTFCSMIVYNGNQTLQLGPDLVRLKERFEVTNGVSEINDINMVMRSMSYCMMIGHDEKVQEIIKSNNWPIKVEKYYETPTLITALTEKYMLNEEEILDTKSNLISMIEKPEIFVHKFKLFTNKF
jgi:hypothetical protein